MSDGCGCGACCREKQRRVDRECIILRLNGWGITVKDWEDVRNFLAMLQHAGDLERVDP